MQHKTAHVLTPETSLFELFKAVLASPEKALVKQHKLEGEPPGRRGTQRPLSPKKMLRQLASWAGMHICPSVQKSEVGAQTQDSLVTNGELQPSQQASAFQPSMLLKVTAT